MLQNFLHLRNKKITMKLLYKIYINCIAKSFSSIYAFCFSYILSQLFCES